MALDAPMRLADYAALCLATAGPTGPGALQAGWSFAPATAGPLLAGLAALLWLARRGNAGWPAFAGWAALAVALASPLCRLAATTAAAHMAQHVILVAIAPALLVAGLPPLRARRFLLRPSLASAVYALAIWLAHAPPVYEAALLDAGAHLTLLAVLLAASLLFWSALLHPERRASAGPMAAAALGLTGILGALLTFAATPWYPVFGPGPALWGLTPQEDQQLAGLVMWVPMSAIYLAAALHALAALLRRTTQA